MSALVSTTEIGARLERIEHRIGEACERSGRKRDEVVLVGVSKGQPIEAIREAIASGVRVLGENRIQEAESKMAQCQDDVDWHLIGPIQSNKVRRAAQFSTIHSVDRPKIARLLDREARRLGTRLPCFVQVKLGTEPSKHGFAPDGLAETVGELLDLGHIRFLGLMAIPPWEQDAERARTWFAQLRRLNESLRNQYAQRWPAALSMGMSHDFETAIEEGATHIRVGSALFGPREG